MNLSFITKLIEEGVSTNSTDKKSGRPFISREGLIEIIKDSAERNGIESIMDLLINGPSYLSIEYDILKDAILKNHEYKDIKILNYSVNFANRTITSKLSYKDIRYSNVPNDNTCCRWRKDEEFCHEVYVNCTVTCDVPFETYQNCVIEHTSSPVEECE